MSARDRWQALPLVNLASIVVPAAIAGGVLLRMSDEGPLLAPITCELLEVGCPEVLPPPAPSLQLTVVIHAQGFIISSANGVLSPTLVEEAGATLPCPSGACEGVGDYDIEGLRALLGEVHRAFPDQDTITLSPTGSVPYEVVVRAMDAARDADGGGFPVVVVSRSLL